jgi:hypothetical protein
LRSGRLWRSGGDRWSAGDRPLHDAGGFRRPWLVRIFWSTFSARRPSLVTLPQLLGRLTASRPVRLLFVVAWAWLGWHLFARGSGAFE